MDVVLAFQASTKNTFDLQKKIAEQMIRRLEVTPDSINVGVVVDRDLQTSKEFGLKEYSSSKSRLMKAVNEMRFSSRATLGPHGLLEFAVKKLFTDTESRKFSPKSIVLFFDKNEDVSAIRKISTLLKRDGINLLTIGVGKDAPISTIVAGLGDKDQVVAIPGVEDITRDDDMINDIIKKALKGKSIMRNKHRV